MIAAKIALLVLLAFVLASPALANADCHRDMKDLLEGTLEVAAGTEAGSEKPQEPADCTLASWTPKQIN